MEILKGGARKRRVPLNFTRMLALKMCLSAACVSEVSTCYAYEIPRGALASENLCSAAIKYNVHPEKHYSDSGSLGIPFTGMGCTCV